MSNCFNKLCQKYFLSPFICLCTSILKKNRLNEDFLIRSTCKELKYHHTCTYKTKLKLKITDISYTSENPSHRAGYHSEICNFKHLTYQMFSPAPTYLILCCVHDQSPSLELQAPLFSLLQFNFYFLLGTPLSLFISTFIHYLLIFK